MPPGIATVARLRRHWPLVLILGVFVGFRIWQLASSFCICTDDDYFSVWATGQSWGAMALSLLRDTVHPPLFYVLLKIWRSAGPHSLMWLGLFPCVFACASVVPLVLLCRALKLRASDERLALLLMAPNGYLIYYSHWLRMYSLLQFLSLCSLWLFVVFLNSPRRTRSLLPLWAVNLLLVYTHYYGWMVVGTEFVLLVLFGRSRLLAFSIGVASLAVCATPWVYAVASLAQREQGLGVRLTDHIGRMADSRILDIGMFYAALDDLWDIRQYPHWWLLAAVPVVLSGYPVLLRAIRVVGGADRQGRTGFWCLVVLAFMPAAVALGVSAFSPLSLLRQHHLIIVAAPFILLVSTAINRLPRALRFPTTALAVAWAVVGGHNYSVQRGSHIAYDLLAQEMVQVEGSDALGLPVFFLSGQLDLILPLKFYVDWRDPGRFGFVVVWKRGVPAGNLYDWAKERGVGVMESNGSAVEALAGGHYWVAYPDQVWAGAPSPQQLLQEKGLRVGSALHSLRHYRGVGLTVFPVWGQTGMSASEAGSLCRAWP